MATARGLLRLVGAAAGLRTAVNFQDACGSLRATDVLAALRLFSGALPRLRALGAGPEPGGAAEPWRPAIDPLARSTGPGRIGLPMRVWLPCADGDEVSATTAPARQVDETTCGSAVLTMLAMAGDSRLAAWVAADPGRRFDELQRRVQRATSRAGLVPWPLRWGTPPWGAAAVARYGAVRYTHRVVGRGERGAEVVRAAVAAAAAGTPVPLFTGGDLGAGWQAAVPRHVVLLVAARAPSASDGELTALDLVTIYDPSSASIHTVPAAVLLEPERADAAEQRLLTAALGGWPHVVWAVLPRG